MTAAAAAVAPSLSVNLLLVAAVAARGLRAWRRHCLDLAKVQTQQGRLFFLILAVGCEWRVLVAQVTCGCRVLVAAVTQPTWQEITRHRLGSGAQLEKLKLNF